MANTKQKIDKINIDNDLESYLTNKFLNGWVLNQIVSLVPVQNKLLCIFIKEEEPPPPPVI